MREINLQEYQQSGPFQLSAGERDLLMERGFDIDVEPAAGSNTEYHLRAGSTVGALQVGNLSVLIIEPKIGIPKLLSLACYAMGRVKFRIEDFQFPDEFALPDALALALSSQAHRAFSGGLLHGYRLEEEALQTIRDGASILTSNYGEGTTPHCLWRFSTMSSLPTYSPTGW